MTSVIPSTRSARCADVSERAFSHPAKFVRLSALSLVFAVMVCGAWDLASAQKNAASATRLVWTPSGALLAARSSRALSGKAEARTQSTGSASGPLIYTIAGSGIGGYSGNGGMATEAGLSNPESIAVDSAGNVYIADSGDFAIRKVTLATGVIFTIAGNGTEGYTGDNGPAASAEIGSVGRICREQRPGHPGATEHSDVSCRGRIRKSLHR